MYLLKQRLFVNVADSDPHQTQNPTFQLFPAIQIKILSIEVLHDTGCMPMII